MTRIWGLGLGLIVFGPGLNWVRDLGWFLGPKIREIKRLFVKYPNN